MHISKLFGFSHRYPQSFLDELAKAWGFKWTKCPPKSILTEDISVCPLEPPTGKLQYIDIKYEKNT